MFILTIKRKNIYIYIQVIFCLNTHTQIANICLKVRSVNRRKNQKNYQKNIIIIMLGVNILLSMRINTIALHADI